MGAVDTPQPRAGKKKKGHGFSRPKRRVGVRIDMTPMVDVAFLLLIFFMVTTVFRTPQALEINLPPARNAKVDVNQEKVLTITVLPDDRSYWKHGHDPWARTEVAMSSLCVKNPTAVPQFVPSLLKIIAAGR